MNTSTLNLRGLRDDGRMILPVLERMSGSVTFWCGFGTKATSVFLSADSFPMTSAGPLCSQSFCDFTTVNSAGAAASSALLPWRSKGEAAADEWAGSAAGGEGASTLMVCDTKFTRASVDRPHWLGVPKKLGSDRGMVGALSQDLGSGGCRRAALDLRRLLKKGVFSFAFCLL